MQRGVPTDPQPAPSGTGTPTESAERSPWEITDRKRRNALIIRVLAGLALLVLFIIFVTLNSESVRVDFVFTETRTPLVWVFLVCALIGALVTFLLGRPARRANRKYIKELERRLEEKGGR